MEQKNRSLMDKIIYTEFGDNPINIFKKWFADAEKSELCDPNAMALATVDPDGKPSVRIVLLKSCDMDGFTFFTNSESDKGRALDSTPYAELNFHWKSLGKQIRIAGPVQKIAPEESDAYFATRPRESQIGAWASYQSRPLESYECFISRVSDMAKKFDGQAIPRPIHWNGYSVKPVRMEFWIAHPHRLHQRFVFEKNNDTWKAQWLNP